MNKVFLCLVILFSLKFNTSAQLLNCLSAFKNDSIARFHPGLNSRFLLYEQHVDNSLKRTSGIPQRLISADSTIVIPVVVHIIYRTASENISDARVHSQINVLNEDFRRLNADRVNAPQIFQSVGGDMKIEFRLACIAPDGNPTNGITRTQTNTQLFGLDNMKFNATGGKDAWPTDTYLNIWVCSLPLFNGYASFPWMYPDDPEKDGVVVHYSVFGITSPNAQKGLGRVCSHEIGHWLGLYHTYDGVKVTMPCEYYDDLVHDTPPQRSSTNCISGGITCTPTNCPTFPHVDFCTPGGFALNAPNGRMFVNFMDQTNDFCVNTFTVGQSQRSRTAFTQSIDGSFTRYQFIENYFSIKKIAPAGCGLTFITLQNPMCLTPTWNITGNGTVTPTATPNVYQLTGTGTVTVEAIGASSYTDTKTFTFSTPDNIDITHTNSGASATVTATAAGIVSSYTWQTTKPQKGMELAGRSFSGKSKHCFP